MHLARFSFLPYIFSVGVEHICEYRDNILRETPLIPEEVFLSILVVPIFTDMLLSLDILLNENTFRNIKLFTNKVNNF